MSLEELEQETRERATQIRSRIAAAAARSKRGAAEIRLVGVSKRQPAERVAAAVLAGVLDLGENYVQEACEKRIRVEALLTGRDCGLPRWHMVGRLQRNKARQALDCFDAIESVDGEKLARELDRRAKTAGRRIEVLLQVNLSGEAQKGGVSPEQLGPLLRACALLPQLEVQGLMTVPAASPDPEASRPTFAQLRTLRDTLRQQPGGGELRELSMGMSSDFETAIEEGATIVRVGTALFGPRETQR